MTNVGPLSEWTVLLGSDDRKEWQSRFAITDFYLNDIAAGVIIQIAKGWPPDAGEAAQIDEVIADRVAEGLRHLVQQLFHIDLIRPVIGVFFADGDVHAESVDRLRQMTWDDELHRGDFTLRQADNRSGAEELLHTLIGDTLGELDANARQDKVGIKEVDDAFRQHQPPKGQQGEDAETRLIEAVFKGLEATMEARQQRPSETPKLAEIVDLWANREAKQ